MSLAPASRCIGTSGRDCSNRCTNSAMAMNWGCAGLKVDRQRAIPLVYKQVRLECGDRVDLVVEHRVLVALKTVERRVLVELKTAEKLLRVHAAQTSTWLRLPGHDAARAATPPSGSTSTSPRCGSASGVSPEGPDPSPRSHPDSPTSPLKSGDGVGTGDRIDVDSHGR